MTSLGPLNSWSADPGMALPVTFHELPPSIDASTRKIKSSPLQTTSPKLSSFRLPALSSTGVRPPPPPQTAYNRLRSCAQDAISVRSIRLELIEPNIDARLNMRSPAAP